MIRKSVYLFCVGAGFTLGFASPRCLLAENLPETVQRLDKEIADLKVKIDKLAITGPTAEQQLDKPVDIFIVPALEFPTDKDVKDCDLKYYDVTIDGAPAGGPAAAMPTSMFPKGGITKIHLDTTRSAVLSITGSLFCVGPQNREEIGIKCSGDKVIKPKPEEQYLAQFRINPSGSKCNIRINERADTLAAPVPAPQSPPK